MRVSEVAILIAILILLSSIVGGAGQQTSADSDTAEHRAFSGITGDTKNQERARIGSAPLIAQDFNVLLKTGRFVPAAGISQNLRYKIDKIITAKPSAKTHVLMQFEHIPSLEERGELMQEGVELLAYVPNNAWYVSLPAGKSGQIAAKPIVRAIDEIKPEYKVSPYIQEGKIGEWAVDGDGQLWQSQHA